MQVRGGLQQLEKGQCCIHLQKRPKGQSKELQNGQTYASPLENNAANPLYEPCRNTFLGTCRMPSVIKLLGLRTRGEQFLSLTSN